MPAVPLPRCAMCALDATHGVYQYVDSQRVLRDHPLRWRTGTRLAAFPLLWCRWHATVEATLRNAQDDPQVLARQSMPNVPRATVS